jgi:hypothetical protein
VTLDLLQSYKAAVGNTIAKNTIMRTHLSVVPQIMATGDTWRIGVRVYEVDDITTTPQANALVANPKDDPYVDWALATQSITDNGLFANVGGSVGLHGTQGLNFDLKSKRKLNNLQETWGLCIYQESVTTVNKAYKVFARTLMALP